MNKTLQASFLELIGTFALTFIGAGAIITTQAGGNGGLVAVAFAHGLALAGAVYVSGHISGGHINPAVTIAMLVNKKMNFWDAVSYIAAQLIGAILAAFLLKSLFPSQAVEAVKLGATLGTDANLAILGAGKTLVIEAILTFLLVITIFAVAVDERGPKNIYGFAIGLTVTFCILIAGPITGASMNPARSFGPALVGAYWSIHWAYWVGPILGAIAGGLFYQKMIIEGDAMDSGSASSSRRKRK